MNKFYVEIILSGEKQYDELVTLYYDGQTESCRLVTQYGVEAESAAEDVAEYETGNKVKYLNNLYRDLLSNSLQTVTIDIPADMGTGQITSGLDYDSMVRVSRLIEQLSNAGIIILVVSHDYFLAIHA